MNTLFLAWISFACISIVLELVVGGSIFFVSFAVGALFAALSTLIPFIASYHVGIFCLSTIVSLLLIYAVVCRMTKKYPSSKKTNIAHLYGKVGVVVVPSDVSLYGQVKIDGEVWRARAIDNEKLIVGNRVEIITVRGAHVVVKLIA